MKSLSSNELNVGIVGAGMGGLMAAIAIARAGARVTILEAAEQLGEIGAGIQMTPNVARLLIRYGVDKVIGNNLTRFSDFNLRRKDGTKIGHTPIKRVEDSTGYPWWVVHRHHLHTGLVEVARQEHVEIAVSSRVTTIAEQADGKVSLTTQQGNQYTFDIVIGSDGLRSAVRNHLFPGVKPRPATSTCAYRAVVPFDAVRKDPATRELVEDSNGRPINTMEVWAADTGYIISYPISDAKEFNMVLSHSHDPPAETVQEVDLEEVKRNYRDYDPRIVRVIEKIDQKISRWPLLVTGPLDSWSNPAGNIVLVGDAAHSMVNHMAQGAATSMEDGAFLARCLERLVISGRGGISDAVKLYEQGRMPQASYKQQLSFLNGWIWHLPDGAAQRARDAAMEGELRGEVPLRSPNLYGDPICVHECYGYDPEFHADELIDTWLNGGRAVRDAASSVEKSQAEKVVNWFLPENAKFKLERSRL